MMCTTQKRIKPSVLHHVMRTTLTLEDDAFATAQAYARARSLKLGQAVSDLIRRGSAQALTIKRNVWVFELPAETPMVTSRQVRQMLDEAE
jgi:predicted DNA-binding ribbon-helix-helix protein